MNILVAVDLSPASASVVAAAGRVAKLTGARVYILHAAEPEPDFVGYDVGPAMVRTQVAREMRSEHRGVQALAEKLRNDGLDATALLVRGPTVEITLKEADNLQAELIVVGTHGHGAVYDMLLGSCSAGIIRKSKLPILVVPVRDA